MGVVADASALHGKGCVAHLGSGYAGNADVDGFGFHVLAVQGNSVAVLAEVVVAPWSAISADDIDNSVGMAEAGHEVMEQIELPDVVIPHISGPVVAEKVVELGDGFRNVVIANPVDHINAFTGMKVIEVQAISRGGRRSVGRRRA